MHLELGKSKPIRAYHNFEGIVLPKKSQVWLTKAYFSKAALLSLPNMCHQKAGLFADISFSGYGASMMVNERKVPRQQWPRRVADKVMPHGEENQAPTETAPVLPAWGVSINTPGWAHS